MNLKENMLKANIICDTLDSLNLGVERGSTKELLYFDLLKFLIHINTDVFDKEELLFIKDYLGFSHSNKTLAELRNRFKTEELDISGVLKYFVLSDIKKTLNSYPAKSQLLVSIYEDLGRSFIACDKNEKKDEISRFTKYIDKLRKYLREFNLDFTLDISDDVKKEVEEDDGKTLEDLLEELNNLTGLESVKNDINELINLIKIQKLREENGLKTTDISKHMVFSGSPGTGKTTVARIIANIYKKMGVCSKGQLVEVDRSGLVVGYIGQTATKTKEVIKKALGGILFIDEAYALTVGKGDGDFGQEAVDTLLKAMEDNRDDLIVIVAGYTDLMEEFLQSNPGFKSRFNKFINFEDFSNEELLDIINKQAIAKDYMINKEAQDYLKVLIDGMTKEKSDDFANARTMRNLLEKAITNQASRIVSLPDIDKDVLTILTKEDFEKD